MIKLIDVDEIVSGTAKVESVSGYTIVLKLNDETLDTATRGDQLLDAEMALREKVDSRIRVFLQPKGDVNKLRTMLRGVKV